MQHYRKTRKQYKVYNAGDKVAEGCTLCKEVGGSKVVQENGTMFMIPNRVPYDMFEGRRVLDHLMVIPKHHRASLSEFTEQEKLDQMAIIADYEAKGYNIYARSTTSVSRSVVHQHTHLIKLSDYEPRFILYAKKPHVLIDR